MIAVPDPDWIPVSTGVVVALEGMRFRSPAGAALSNANAEDGSGAFTNDGNNQTYEFLHPLKSGDPHDFSLDHGARIGMRLFVRVQQANGTFQDTTLPNNPDGFIKLGIR